MKVRTGWLIVCYNGAFHSCSGQTRCCTELSRGTADSHWQQSRSSKPLHLLSQSGHRTPLLVLDIADVWKRKSIILSLLSASFIHRLSVSISRARYPTHSSLCKWKMSRRDHLAEPCLVRGKSLRSASMRHSVPLTYHCHYTGMHGADSGQRLLLCSLGVTYTKSTNFPGAKGVRQTANQDWAANIFLRVDSAVRKDLVRDLSEGQQGSFDSTEWAGTQPHLFLRHFKRKGERNARFAGHEQTICILVRIFLICKDTALFLCYYHLW